MSTQFSMGLIGARGYVGVELIKLVAGHPHIELAYVASREMAGRPLSDLVPEYPGELRFVAPDPDALATYQPDVVVLALPNGKAAPFVDALAGPVLIDLSADYRFDDTWYYGLPELTRARYQGQRRISNPGCYATAMQLAIAPLADGLDGPVQCFGVSGYSGAGTTPSDKNDPDKLRDNVMPYGLTGHVHEREVTRQLGRAVEFMPHVAPHFRGLTITANLHLNRPMDRDAVAALYQEHYKDEALVQVLDEAPWVSRISGQHRAEVGGFAVAGRRVVVVATLDNLLKGAATQALQNINTALELDELAGIAVPNDK